MHLLLLLSCLLLLRKSHLILLITHRCSWLISGLGKQLGLRLLNNGAFRFRFLNLARVADMTSQSWLLLRQELLSIDEGAEVFNCRLRFVVQSLVLEVDEHVLARLDLRVRQEQLQERLNLTFALLDKLWLALTPPLLFRERRQYIATSDVPLHCRLEFAQ